MFVPFQPLIPFVGRVKLTRRPLLLEEVRSAHWTLVSALSAEFPPPLRLFALKCNTKFGEITIVPEELLEELDDELELLPELDEDEVVEEDDEPEEELLDDPELLPPLEEELLDEDPTQTGILHWRVELFKQQGVLFPVHVNDSLTVQFGMSPDEQ